MGAKSSLAQESVMKKRFAESLGAAIVAGLLTLPASVVLAGDLEIGGSVTLGAQHLELDGDDDSKFEEYRDLDDDIVLHEILLYGRKDDYHFALEGQNLIRDDRSALIEAGRYGKYEVQIRWDEIIHNFKPNNRFLGTLSGDGYWAVPDVVQQTLEPNFPLGDCERFPGDPTPPPCSPTAAGRNDLLDLLGHAPTVDLRLEREIGRINLAYSPFQSFNLRAGYLHEDRKGLRAMSTGAYRRDGDGANLVGGVGENFTLYGLEFPEPIQYDTNELNFGLDYRQANRLFNWHVDLNYHFTYFENEISFVTWDNPLRFTDAEIQGGAAQGRLDLFPDSQSHSISLTGGISALPLNSKLTTTVSWGRITQNDDFLPYTVNRALTIDATGGPHDGDPGWNAPLPVNDLDGQVDTLLVNAVLSSRPIDPLSLTFKVNYYDYDNDSEAISWVDGWARIGESDWSKAAEAGVFNRVPKWERIRTDAEVAYKVHKMLTLIADYRYESYERNRDRNADTDEHIYGGGIKLTPCDQAMMRLSYHRSDREIDGAYSPAPAEPFFEWEELRMFDQSDRERDRIDAYLSLDPIDRLSLGFSFNYNDDEYDTSFYGLQRSSGFTTGADLSYAVLDRVTLFGYYSRDDYETRTKTRAKSDAAGGGSFAVPENDWLTGIDDVANTVGAGITVEVIPEKLSFGLGADYSFAESEIRGTNPDFVAGTTTSSATAYDWPDLEIETTEVKADLNYNFTEHLSTGLRYVYKMFDLDDAAWNSVSAYGNPPDTQGNRLDYFIFMDANYGDYDAHLVTWTVSYRF
jgi:MtrB/PioB family decaheme-associated outer membrane protein